MDRNNIKYIMLESTFKLNSNDLMDLIYKLKENDKALYDFYTKDQFRWKKQFERDFSNFQINESKTYYQNYELLYDAKRKIFGYFDKYIVRTLDPVNINSQMMQFSPRLGRNYSVKDYSYKKYDLFDLLLKGIGIGFTKITFPIPIIAYGSRSKSYFLKTDFIFIKKYESRISYNLYTEDKYKDESKSYLFFLIDEEFTELNNLIEQNKFIEVNELFIRDYLNNLLGKIWYNAQIENSREDIVLNKLEQYITYTI